MNKRIRYSPEVQERAVRMVFERQSDHVLQWAAINSIRSHSALGYRPPAPQTIVPHRGDPPFAPGGYGLIAARQTPRTVYT